jgi:hypothetical protein
MRVLVHLGFRQPELNTIGRLDLRLLLLGGLQPLEKLEHLGNRRRENAHGPSGQRQRGGQKYDRNLPY